MSIEAEQRAARELTARTDQVGRISGRTPWHEALHRLSGGRLGRAAGPAIPIQLDTPWQDTPSPLRTGWRQRGANLGGESVFVSATVETKATDGGSKAGRSRIS